MNSIQQWLEPISPESPCGEAIEYDLKFQELLTYIQGTPAVEVRGNDGEVRVIKPAEDPDWRQVVERAEGLLRRSKELQLGVLYTLGLLQTQGLVGFRDGLALLRGWIEKYWDTLYPRLDPEDKNDPTQRINILSGMAMKTFGDPYRFLQRLRETPLAESPALGKFSLEKMSLAPEDPGGPAAFRQMDSAQLQERFKAIQESVGILKEIDELLVKLTSTGAAPSFEELEKTLKEIQACMAPYAASGTAASAEAGGGNASGEAMGQGWSRGPVHSRQDVLKALQAICDYYQKCEPSSPVPFLLFRAQRLAELDFMSIMNDLAPESLDKMRVVMGTPGANQPPNAA